MYLLIYIYSLFCIYLFILGGRGGTYFDQCCEILRSMATQCLAVEEQDFVTIFVKVIRIRRLEMCHYNSIIPFYRLLNGIRSCKQAFSEHSKIIMEEDWYIIFVFTDNRINTSVL